MPKALRKKGSCTRKVQILHARALYPRLFMKNAAAPIPTAHKIVITSNDAMMAVLLTVFPPPPLLY